MAWIGFRKAYDVVPPLWMIKPTELVVAAKKIANLHKETITNWKTNLICSNTDLEKMNLNHEIFQGDSLSPLMFEVSLLQLKLLLRKMNQWYRSAKRKSKLKHLLFMDDLKLHEVRKPDIDTIIHTVYTAERWYRHEIRYW